MKLSRLHKMTAGVLIILTGIGLLLDTLHIISFSLFSLWPMVLVYVGVRMWEKQKRIRGGLLAGFGVLIALDMWFGVGFHDLFHFVVPLALIYFGFRLIRGRSRRRDGRADTVGDSDGFSPEWDTPDDAPFYQKQKAARWAKQKGYGPVFEDRVETPFHPGCILRPKDTRSSLIGDFHLTSGRFELDQLHIWHGIGDVVIDLSRAMVMQEEAFLTVDGWVGDVTIYVPVDMPVAVTAEVSIGDLEVFGHRQGGISRSVMVRSEQYEQAAQKVHLQISLLVGDIKVKYI
ncbi:cell wall-active antibiotics response protein LiaF [Brevibacillus sp. WF146]|uniref:cell wall-active antibiotics response protein LiaF n=1 Tax=Brevibacillus sp. WF146 TaxID=319501 RepID=UPI0007ECD826|nr:cell wall-active antibiotics response protein LiaF [Brevibacillus sp. WF146]UYZ12974.1 cell wall-active antibiotics response protein LiaF [Brevibacillus sp. WF146]